jgi:hypothetical protein
VGDHIARKKDQELAMGCVGLAPSRPGSRRYGGMQAPGKGGRRGGRQKALRRVVGVSLRGAELGVPQQHADLVQRRAEVGQSFRQQKVLAGELDMETGQLAAGGVRRD